MPRVNSSNVGVMAGERIRHCVQTTRSVLHREIEAEELANPLVLRNGGQTLVKQKFETVVICVNQEGTPPEVGTPMAHCPINSCS
jgi:hypothetical protein